MSPSKIRFIDPAATLSNVSPTCSDQTLTTATSSEAVPPAGTWRTFKGKVTQKFEDIKLAKIEKQQIANTLSTHKVYYIAEPDSDQDNSASSEYIPLSKKAAAAGDSDSDLENELIFEIGDDRSRLRRGIANLKSKVKAKSAARYQSHHSSSSSLPSYLHKMKRDNSPNPAPSQSSSSSSLRNNFLRLRRNKEDDATTTSLSSDAIPVAKPSPKKKKGIVSGKKDVEIESGVEMLEEMIMAADNKENSAAQQKRSEMELPLGNSLTGDLKSNKETQKSASYTLGKSSASLNSAAATYFSCTDSETTSSTDKFYINTILVIALCYSLLYYLPIPDFMKGVIAALLAIGLLEPLWNVVQNIILQLVVKYHPERRPFEIPDYTQMPILEIPPIEEHSTVRQYAGWMNEVNTYDPATFHISMSKSVYIKLEGSFMRMYATNARIPKKAMWNEPLIDRKALTFTSIRTFDLTDCRIELLPLGIAKKRYFNRKYPIQLILKRCINDHGKVNNLFITPRPSAQTMASGKDVDAKDNKQFQPAGNADERGEKNSATLEDQPAQDIDFAATVLNCDLQTLNPTEITKETGTMPCGDEMRLLLFARVDREKEDWYRRFDAASKGNIFDQELRFPNMRFINDTDLQAAAIKAALLLTVPQEATTGQQPQVDSLGGDEDGAHSLMEENNGESASQLSDNENDIENLNDDEPAEANANEGEFFEGLIMSACAARNQPDYLKFISLYQKSCTESTIPVIKNRASSHYDDKMKGRRRKSRRAKNTEELWKGVDQSLFLGPSGSVVWANVLAGRFIYSCLNNFELLLKIHEMFQRKMGSIRLPNFIEEIIITNIDLGDKPPLIHRISQPFLDERGTWVDADITYEGNIHITIATRLNLLRMRRRVYANTAVSMVPTNHSIPTINITDDGGGTTGVNLNLQATASTETQLRDAISGSVIFDSDAESEGSSSSEGESPAASINQETTPLNEFQQGGVPNARRIFKIVDRIATSNFFQYATELSYVQKAMENLSSSITLRVDIKGVVGRAVINIPPPPSDRIWLAFRSPPRLWITAKPMVGDKSVDWSIVTNIIESKICEEVNKIIVYPNMVDVTIPLLGTSTYKEQV